MRTSDDVTIAAALPPDPIEWTKRKMLAELNKYVKPKEKIAIKHLKGYPSNRGYLEWLRSFEEKFVGRADDDILLHANNRKDFIAKVHEQIVLEIEKRKAELDALESSYDAVYAYISHLAENVSRWSHILRISPGTQDEAIHRFISESEETMAEYAKLFPPTPAKRSLSKAK
jgi:hypothetical protein